MRIPAGVKGYSTEWAGTSACPGQKPSFGFSPTTPKPSGEPSRGIHKRALHWRLLSRPALAHNKLKTPSRCEFNHQRRSENGEFYTTPRDRYRLRRAAKQPRTSHKV